MLPGGLEEDEWESASGSEAESASGAASSKGSMPRQSANGSEASGDADEDGPLALSDLVDLTRSRLQQLAQQNPQLLHQCCASLTRAQLQVVQACF